MTKAEAIAKYEEAKRDRNRMRAKAEDANSERKRKNAAKNEKYSEKKDLDKRLSGLNNVIRFFEQTLADQISTTNNKARAAAGSYCAAIHCDNNEIPNASLSDTFHTDTVSGNENTKRAYTSCVAERNRVRNVINELDREITRLENAIDDLNESIRYYNNKANDYQYTMNYCERFF